MIDQIGGWARVGIGASYGEGYTAHMLLKLLAQVRRPNPRDAPVTIAIFVI